MTASPQHSNSPGLRFACAATGRARIRGPARATRPTGFTLIEVLVALVIVAVAIGALARAGGQALAVQHQLQQRTLALWVADNQLAELALEAPVRDGPRHGVARMAGRDWHWQARIEAAPGGDLWRADITVFANADAAEPVLTHTGFLER